MDHAARGARLQADLDAASDLLHLVHLQGPFRWSVDHGARDDVKAGTVTLAHDRGLREQASGEWACLVASAGTQIVERVEAIGDTGDRDPDFAVIHVVRNDHFGRDRSGRPDRPECITGEDSHRFSS